MKNKLASLLLCLLILVPTLTACASDSGNNADTTAADTTTAAETQAELTNEDLYLMAVSRLPEKDYGGIDFNIAYRNPNNNTYWYVRDIFAEDENGEPINDAVYKRNTTLEEEFNINITEFTSSDTAANHVKNTVSAGEDVYTLITDAFNSLCNLSVSGYLYDYYDVPGIDPSNSWWDQYMVEDCSIKDKLYFLTGDVSIMDNFGTWCILFMKSFVEEYSMNDPYELVRNGSWTMDALLEMTRMVTRDLNGDGEMKMTDDVYGFYSEGFNTYGLWACAGEKITTKNSDDIPELSLYSERSASVMEKVLEMQYDEGTIENTNDYFDHLDAGRAFMRFGGMKMISDARSRLENDFGVLPAPKFNENQDKYYTTYSYGNLTAYSIPISVADAEMAGIILEAMAELSVYSLTPAYYDTTIINKALRDEDSQEMIEIILANRNYDLGSTFNWGASFTLFTTMWKEKATDFASRCAAIEKAAVTAIGSFVDSLE